METQEFSMTKGEFAMKNLVMILCLLFLGSGNAIAQTCTPAPSCTSLGFTMTAADCPKEMVKCPWNTAFGYCKCSEKYKYTCTNTNESPSSAKCGNKYSSCNCATGFSWKDNACKADIAICSIGWIYYSDNTCSLNIIAGKTALGVVVYVNADGIGGQVMTAKSIGSTSWGSRSDLSALPNYTSKQSASIDYNSCKNTDVIVAYGSRGLAAHMASNYAPTPETLGKWCLPAAGIMTSIKNNQSAVQAGIAKLGGTAFPSCCIWSSSEYQTYKAWYSDLDSSFGLYDWGTKNEYFPEYFININKEDYHDVRPVLEF